MKKVIVLLAVLCFTAATASAQIFRFGVKGGLTSLSTDIRGQHFENDLLRSNSWLESRSVGWQLGFVGRLSLPLTNLYIQPELVFNHAGYKYRTADDSFRSNIRYNNIELPVLLGFRILFLNFTAGPVFNLGAFESNKDEFSLERPSVGFQIGTGFTYQQLGFDIRYHNYFESNKKNLNFNNVYNKIKTNEGFWSFTFSYFFN